jgi:hypothetical protein
LRTKKLAFKWLMLHNFRYVPPQGDDITRVWNLPSECQCTLFSRYISTWTKLQNNGLPQLQYSSIASKNQQNLTLETLFWTGLQQNEILLRTGQ